MEPRDTEKIKKNIKAEAGSKLRIAMLGHKRIPSREGGIEVVVQELSSRMVKQGHCVTCYNRSGHHISGREYDGGEAFGKNGRLGEYQGVILKYVPTIDKRGLAAMTSSVFGAIFAALGKYEVVHFHAEGPAFMCWLPKLLGKRVVVTVHGLDHKRAKWGKLASKYIMAGERNAVRFADEIIVLSKSVQSYFRETYGRRTRLIPNGVSRPALIGDGILKKKYGLDKDGYILFVGRIVPEKGIQCLIEAFKRVHCDKKLVIAGGSSDTGRFMTGLKELADDDDRIIFTGFVQGKELGALYSNAYLYVLPSDLEGMPLSLLEAMSYGNCCVVSDIPECSEVVEDYGVVFERGNVEALRAAMQRLNDNPEIRERYKIVSNGYICQRYNWDDVAGQTLDLYMQENGSERRLSIFWHET